MKLEHIQDVRDLAKKGFEAGATLDRLSTVTWNAHGSCERPVLVSKAARPYAGKDGLFHWEPGKATRLDIDVWVRCRKCTKCLRARARKWQMKAEGELRRAVRTWFCTLTLSPQEHYLAEARAVRAVGTSRFYAASEAQRYAWLVRACSRELTNWLKRVRKQSSAPIRYLLVAEKHKSGLPHFHALIHEGSVDKPVRWKHLSSAWRLGHSRFNLVKPGTASAHYVTKYLSKSAEARVRASVRYGLTPNPPKGIANVNAA